MRECQYLVLVVLLALSGCDSDKPPKAKAANPSPPATTQACRRASATTDPGCCARATSHRPCPCPCPCRATVPGRIHP